MLLLPERGVENVWILLVDADIVRARVFVTIQHFVERLATVERTEHAALAVGAIGMAEYRDEEPVRVGRIDVDHGDHLTVAEPQVLPRRATVSGLVHTVANGEIGADDTCAAADVDHVRIGRCDRDGSDGARGLFVEDRHPVGAVVRGSKDAAVIVADVEHIRLAWHAGQRTRAAAAHRSYVAPVHAGGDVGLLRREECWRRRRGGEDEQREAAQGVTHVDRTSWSWEEYGLWRRVAEERALHYRIHGRRFSLDVGQIPAQGNWHRPALRNAR